jgi:hypothetical protein
LTKEVFCDTILHEQVIELRIIMGRNPIAKQSEVAHFRIDSRHKKILETYAKRERKKFSDLARQAIEEYIRVVEDEAELRKLANKEHYRKTVRAYEKAKKLIRQGEDITGSNIEVLEKLHSYVEALQEHVPKKIPLKNIYPEVLKYSSELLVGIARQYLVFHRKMGAWSNRMEETHKYVDVITSGIGSRHTDPPRRKRKANKK